MPIHIFVAQVSLFTILILIFKNQDQIAKAFAPA